MQHNAVVHTQKGAVVVNSATDAYIKLPGPGNMNAQGMQVTTDVLVEQKTQSNETCVFSSGDILFVDSRRDFPTPGQVTRYVIQKAMPSGIGRLAIWRVEVDGAIR